MTVFAFKTTLSRVPFDPPQEDDLMVKIVDSRPEGIAVDICRVVPCGFLPVTEEMMANYVISRLALLKTPVAVGDEFFIRIDYDGVYEGLDPKKNYEVAETPAIEPEPPHVQV